MSQVIDNDILQINRSFDDQNCFSDVEAEYLDMRV